MPKEPFDYNEFYKTQPVNFIDYPARFALVASLCRGKVFDIGCGFGALSDYYFGNYFGFDFSEYVIEKAKEVRRKDATFVLHDCSNLTSLGIENCDTFVFAEFLEHFENDDLILGPIFSRAKPGTRIVITVPNSDRIPDPSHLRTLTIPELRKKFSPYGKVKFYNWENSTLHIICTVDLDKRNEIRCPDCGDLLTKNLDHSDSCHPNPQIPSPSLEKNDVSLVMIVKDEEKGLERAVFSCLEFVDNIVIAVDSRTTDKTAEIAKLYADTLKTFDWQDDFSAARNFAHQGVKTKWILFLDGHEYVAKRENLEKFLAIDVDGLLIPIEMENKFIFNNPRFYKTGIQFEGKVHERQACKVTYFYPDFLIVHDRLTAQTNEAVSARLQQRDEMVPRIMGEELKKNPKNTRAALHLAMYWQSKKQFKKALSIYSQYLKFSKNPQESWFVFFNRCLCYLVLGKKFRAFFSANRADWEMPGRWEIEKIKGMMFFEKKQYEKALECLNLSFQENSFNTLYRPLPRENSSTWNLIGECFFNLSNFDKANIAFDRAADLTKDKDAKEFFEKRAALMRDILKASLKQ